MTKEEKKIIQSHRILFDIKKAGRKYDGLITVLNNPTKEEEKELYSFCSQHNFVTYLVEVLGEWQLEIETEVDNGEQTYELLREIKNRFPEIILDYDILGVVQEHKLNYLPMGRIAEGIKRKEVILFLLMDIQVAIIKVKTDSERVKKALKKASQILNGELPKVSDTCEYCKWKELKFA